MGYIYISIMKDNDTDKLKKKLKHMKGEALSGPAT